VRKKPIDLRDREIIRLRDENKRLNREIKTIHRSVLAEDEVRRILGVLGTKREKPPKWLVKPDSGPVTPEVPVTIWSDWHGGEMVSRAETNGINEFNLEVLRRRVHDLVERTIRLADRHKGNFPGVVVNLLGDLVSGGLHPELAKTDEIESIGAALEVRDLLVWALEEMEDRFGQVFCPCASGNHGRNTVKPEFKRYVFKNFDWMIYQLLQRYFTEQGNDNIHFAIRPANEVYYKVWNKGFLAMHGDMLGVKGGDGMIGSIGPIMRGEIKAHGAAWGEYDVLLMGHWHQPLWLPRVVVANSLKGYDEYAKNKLRAPATTPSQPLFFVHPRYGITSRWEVYLEGAEKSRHVDWVSIFDDSTRSLAA